MSSQQTSSSQSQSQSSPWGPQATAVQNAFGLADTAYNKASTATAPTNFTAQMTPEQMSTFHSMLDYANSNTSPQTANNLGNSMGTSGLSGYQGALNTLGAFNAGATNNASAIANGASTYANGVDLNGAVKAAMQPAMETARDVTLPGMESAAAGNGNINSSRTALSEGLVQRGLAENAQNTYAQMYNNAYNTGAGLTENALTQNNQQNLAAASTTGALGNAGVNTGVGALASGIADATGLYNIAGTGGSGLQQNNQEGLTNQLQQYQSAVNSPFDALNNYWNIIGSKNWGSNTSGTSSGTSTSTPSALSLIGSGLGMAGSLFKM